ncbi:hypothetical protein FGO68_gene10198 [Halteria grandinella]|uniref:Uncharacterized protein n=1 Tax=Halteria grandinella TaxID=5974 RepID=A0A8J8P1W6_HALGN|nr:hypothetical protein FGO68_gene10198 [Halteria grandinella]
MIVKRGRAEEKKFSPLIEGVKNEGISRYWNIIALAKWCVMCFTLIMLMGYPQQQMQILLAISIFSTAIQLSVKPQDSYLEQYMSLFNDLMSSLYIYTLQCLSFTTSSTLKQTLGLILLSLMLFTVFVNILKVLIVIFVGVKGKYNAWVIRRQNRVVNISKYKIDDGVSFGLDAGILKMKKVVRKKKKRKTLDQIMV